MSEHIDTPLILAAWGMAQTHRQPPAGLVFHSDRGVQYASLDYRHALQSVAANQTGPGNAHRDEPFL
jgi:transposase InsO family protein